MAAAPPREIALVTQKIPEEASINFAVSLNIPLQLRGRNV